MINRRTGEMKEEKDINKMENIKLKSTEKIKGREEWRR